MTSDQTILEYGSGLAEYVATDDAYLVDSARMAARDRSLAGAVNRSKYAPAGLRERALGDARQHWSVCAITYGSCAAADKAGLAVCSNCAGICSMLRPQLSKPARSRVGECGRGSQQRARCGRCAQCPMEE